MKYTVWTKKGNAAKQAAVTVDLEQDADFMSVVVRAAEKVLAKAGPGVSVFVYEHGDSGHTRWMGYRGAKKT